MLPQKIKEMVINELRGVKSIQNDYMKTVDAIAQTLELYKNSKGTPNEKKAVERLKQLQTLKKKFADELEAKVSGMYKDVELKADVDEMNTSGAAGPYNTPFAFGKGENEKTKGKKQADLTGYSVVSENINNTIKKLKTLIEKQFNVIEFKAPVKRPLSDSEFLMIKVKDDKYGGPQSGLGKFIKKWTGVEASFVESAGVVKTYWVSLKKIEK